MNVKESPKNEFETIPNERLSQTMEAQDHQTMASSRGSGLSMVKNLLRARKQKEIQRAELVRKQRGVNPTRLGYTNDYFNFHS